MNTEQVIKATKVLEGAKVMVTNRDFNEFQDAIITAINALALIKDSKEIQVDAAKIFEEFETLVTQKDIPITTMALLATKEYADFKKKWANL